MSETSSRGVVKKWATARRPRRCRECGREIPVGSRYWQVQPPFVPAVGFCSEECDFVS